jgi:homoaconitate hydratase family protein
MPMTATEKILARGAGRDSVKPGEIVDVAVDRAMIHDNNAALVIRNFNLIHSPKVWAPEKVFFFIDHHSPSTSAKATRHQDAMRRFAGEHSIRNFYDCGSGISHVVMLENSFAQPGEIVVGTDSHTTGQGACGSFATGIGATEMAAVLVKGTIWMKVPRTVRVNGKGSLPLGSTARDLVNLVLRHFGPDGANYCAVEFGGEAFDRMNQDERTMACVMSMEMGAKNALFVGGEADPAAYDSIAEFDAGSVKPMVAVPTLPTNAVPAEEVGKEKVPVNQAVIASCAGALLSDLKAAAEILKGRTVAGGTRLLVIPATRKIYNDALALGYIQSLSTAGAIISSPGCGACGGHDMGILAEGEVCISSSTRNMPGRMGAGGVVYLGSSATVAASAVTGYITDPREFLSGEGRCGDAE